MLTLNIEKVLVAIFLFAYIAFVATLNVEMELPLIKFITAFSSIVAVILLCLYYTFRVGFSPYSILFIFMMLGFSGGLFKILHLPGADLLIIILYFSTFITALVLLTSSLKGRKKKGGTTSYQLAISSILIIQFFHGVWVHILRLSEMRYLNLLGHYVIIAIIITMVFKPVAIKANHGRLLTLTLLLSIMSVLSELLL